MRRTDSGAGRHARAEPESAALRARIREHGTGHRSRREGIRFGCARADVPRCGECVHDEESRLTSFRNAATSVRFCPICGSVPSKTRAPTRRKPPLCAKGRIHNWSGTVKTNILALGALALLLSPCAAFADVAADVCPPFGFVNDTNLVLNPSFEKADRGGENHSAAKYWLLHTDNQGSPI